MPAKTCGKCEYFLKVNWNDNPGSGRNGLCQKYDYNIASDGTYAQRCGGYKHKAYKRIKNMASDFSSDRWYA